MNLGLSSVLRGLPGFIGVLVGIALYAKQINAGILVACLLVLFSALFLSRELFIKYPLLALVLLEPWVLSAVCIVALCTQLILWFIVASPNWFALEKPRLDAVTGALIGALTTYLATVWIKDIQESKGPFLPSTQFQQNLATHFTVAHEIKGDNLVWRACNNDFVQDGIEGWGLISRWKRAKILTEYLKSKKPKVTPD